MKIKITLIDIIRKDMAISKIIEKKIHVRISNQSQKIFIFFFFGETNTHKERGKDSNTKTCYITKKVWN